MTYMRVRRVSLRSDTNPARQSWGATYESPDFPVLEGVKDASNGEVLVLKVTSVNVDAVLDELALLLRQEGGLSREVGNKGVTDEGGDDGEETHHCGRQCSQLEPAFARRTRM